MDRFENHWQTILKDKKGFDYSMNQLKNPKRSTFFFSRYFHELFSASKAIIDLGGGNGSATQFFAKLYPDVDFVCADFSDDLLNSGRKIINTKGVKNLTFRKVDWFHLDDMLGEFDRVISLQTLSWLSNFETPLEQIFSKIEPDWIGISSMFYDGNISAKVEITEHVVDRYSYYNTYSLPQVSSFCKRFKYELAASEDFDIDTDICAPDDNDRMATYTVRVADSEFEQRKNLVKRLQISGPVLMNWKNILIKKISTLA